MNLIPLPVPLIMAGDLPPTQVAGAIQNVDNPAILQNIGGAIKYTIQSIVLRDNQHHLGGTIRFYLYQNVDAAMRFFSRVTEHFEGQPLADIGEQALIKTTPHLLQFPESMTTALRFRRGCALVNIVGSFQPDPSFSQGYLTQEDVVAYARHLDQRLAQVLTKSDNQ